MAPLNSEFAYLRRKRHKQTTDATPFVALEIDAPDRTSGLVVVSVVVAPVNRATMYCKALQRPYRRNGAAVALAGAGAALYADGDAGLAAIAVAIGVTGTKIQVTITGIAATVLDWFVVADWSVH